MSAEAVLITGGGGFIGAAVARALICKSVPVVIYDQRPPAPLSPDDPIQSAAAIVGDILDPFSLLRAVEKHNVKRFLHTASIVGAGLSIDNPVRTLEVNLMGLTNVLETARSLKLGRIVQISSQSVYGPGQYEPVDEKHPTDPDSPYGVTKLAGEKWGNVYTSAFGVDFVALRMPHIYGPGRPAGLRGNVIQDMLEAAQTGKPFSMKAGGDQNKEPVYIEDIVSATLTALDIPASSLSGRAYNIGVGEVFSWRRIADAIRELYPKAQLELGPGPIVVRGDVLEQKLGPLDYSLARQVLGYEPKFKLRGGIRQFAQWLDANRKAGR
jgi:nucleoside-diphosphate-sugar epimerase